MSIPASECSHECGQLESLNPVLCREISVIIVRRLKKVDDSFEIIE